MHVGDGVAHPGVASALRAGLANALVLAGGLDDLATLPDIVADGLLDIHVLAILHRPDGAESMPVIWRGDGNDVDRLVGDHFADVLLELGGLPLAFLEGLHRLANDAFVAITNRDDLAAVLFIEAADMAHAAAIHTDDGNAHLFIRANPAALGGLFLGGRR